MLDRETLSWHLSTPDQEYGISVWSKQDNLHDLFDGLLESGRKELWQNAARILKFRADEDVASISGALLEWYMARIGPALQKWISA